MSHSRIALLALPILVIFLAINRVDQLLWTFFLGPKLFFGDTRGPYVPPMINSGGVPDEPPDDPDRKSWPLDDVRYLDREIVVQTGTTFTYNGVPCRLLGVKESSDPIKQAEAKAFAQLWFENFRGFNIRNWRAPLVESGTSVVLVVDCNPGWTDLSEELVRAGLATMDRLSNQDYEFEVLVFSRRSLEKFKWKSKLLEAEKDFANGNRSNFYLEWQAELNSPKADTPSDSDVMP